MKKVLITILLVTPIFLIAQNNEGKIIYNEKVKLDIDVPEEHREQLKGVLPEARTTKKILLFNATESIYKDQAGQDDENVVEAGSEHSGMHIKMVMKRPDNQLYKNIAKKEIFEKQEFFDRDFLITSKTEKFTWKLTNEAKEIAGYSCQKAVIDDDDSTIEAWFAPQIPVSNGPMHYGALPGMIMELDIDNGQTHITTTDVQLMKLEEDAIQAPKKGKKVTREEYEEIVEKKQKEMEEEYGGKGRMIIRTRRN